jgi:hypothetical protein
MKISAMAALLGAILACMPSQLSSSADEANSPELVTAKTAYAQAYPAARKIAPDAILVRLAPNSVDFKNGRAGLWEATFASPGKHECWIVSYASAPHPFEARKGITVGAAIPWSGCLNEDVKLIPVSEFRIDSDAAYTLATAEAATWRKQHPERNLTSFQLSKYSPLPVPTWYVIWGDTGIGYVVQVNANTGKTAQKGPL